MRRKLGYKIVFIALFFCSCGSEWISDPIDPRLPMYTEDGNDVAGAFVNGRLWEARNGGLFSMNDPVPQLYYDSDGDSLVIEIEDLVFILYGLEMKDVKGLEAYAGRKFPLGAGANDAYFGSIEYRDCAASGIGQFFLRTVRETDSGMIMAGTFSFTIDHPDCGRIEVTHGRFDFKIG